jgi:cytochrome P450
MSRPIEIQELPPLEAYGSLHGRDDFRDSCRKLFAGPDPAFVRHPNGQLVVFRNRHLRALATQAAAGNVPPDVLAKGSFEAVRDERTAPPGTGSALVRVLAQQVFFTNEPLHEPARRILTSQLSPRAVAGLEPLADRLISELLSGLADLGEIDFQRQFADELTTRFWAALIGMTAEEQAALADVVRRMSGLFYLRPSPDEVRTFDTAAAEYDEIIGNAGRRSLRNGGFPLVDAMAADLARLDFHDDPAEAGIVPTDVGAFLAGNLIDALHTAALAAANAAFTVLRHPGVLDQLRADPSLVPAAAFEALRLESPVLHLSRYALEEIVFEGVRIPKGVRFMMCWAAGNLDPEAFPDPERLRLDRPLRGGCTFGAGAQICPGRIVASMLVQRTLQALAQSGLVCEMNQAGCDWYDRSAMAQMKSFPIALGSRST